MKNILFLLFILVCIQINAQELTGPELLDKAIAYHDPNSNWNNFKGSLYIELEMPDRPNRSSEVVIDLPKEFFSLKETRGDTTTQRTVNKGLCSFSLNGKDKLSEEQLKRYRGDCERSTMMKNYYTYLYGLPMKLKDPGTNIDPKVQRKTFKGKEYLVLKVSYDKTVGKDTWYFYFDPETYAMQVYQFFKDETKNDGEYILLSETIRVNGIEMPKNRAWYYNNNDGYLGTDRLTPNKKI